jgi:hypothetical protein
MRKILYIAAAIVIAQSVVANDKLSSQDADVADTQVDNVALLKKERDSLSQELKFYKRQYLINEVPSYIVKPFSQMDTLHLQKLMKIMDEYSADDKEVASLRTSLKTAINHRNVYQDGLNTLTVPVDSTRIAFVLGKIRNLKNEDLTAEQKAELEACKGNMRKYPKRVVLLQEAVELINSSVNHQSNAKMRQQVLDRIIDNEAAVKDSLKFLPDYPYLQRLYNEYIDSLKYVKHPAVCDKILNLKGKEYLSKYNTTR